MHDNTISCTKYLNNIESISAVTSSIFRLQLFSTQSWSCIAHIEAISQRAIGDSFRAGRRWGFDPHCSEANAPTQPRDVGLGRGCQTSLLPPCVPLLISDLQISLTAMNSSRSAACTLSNTDYIQGCTQAASISTNPILLHRAKGGFTKPAAVTTRTLKLKY